MVELRDKVSSYATDLQAAKEALEALEDKLKHEGETARVKIESLSKEFELSKEQFHVTKEENTTLHAQLENLSTQLTALRQMLSTEESTSAAAAAAGGGDGASRMDTSLLGRSFHEVTAHIAFPSDMNECQVFLQILDSVLFSNKFAIFLG